MTASARAALVAEATARARHPGPTLVPFATAQQAVLDACIPLGTEHVPLANAVDRVLAADVVASADLVPFARSAMDGYALTADDVRALPARFPLGETVLARAGESHHVRGTATPIATGAPLPYGSDAVVPVEDVELEGDDILVVAPLAAGDHVFPPGEDARAGDLLATAGTRLRPAALGLLAAAGCDIVEVFRRPRVAVFSTGDELVPPGAEPRRGQVRDSNAIVAAGLLTGFGGDVVGAEHVPDTREALRARLEAAAAGGVDLIVTTGGASVGPRDYVKAVLRELGFAFAFDTVALRPAKPAAFAVRAGLRVAVLPGNPSAAFVGLHEFVGPAIRRMLGSPGPLPPRVAARLEGRVRAKPGRAFAAFAALRLDAGTLVATLLDNQCSSLTRTSAEAAGLVIVPPGEGTYASGELVPVDVLDWSLVQT